MAKEGRNSKGVIGTTANLNIGREVRGMFKTRITGRILLRGITHKSIKTEGSTRANK